MAQQRRDWSRLGERQRKRYIGAGRKQGLTEAQVIQHYESGGNLSAWRGQRPTQRPGISERKWRQLRAAAKRAQLENATEVLESLVQKGFTAEWILHELEQQYVARTEFRSAPRRAMRAQRIDAGWQPGRNRYKRRNLTADIEIYYYH